MTEYLKKTKTYYQPTRKNIHTCIYCKSVYGEQVKFCENCGAVMVYKDDRRTHLKDDRRADPQ